jgi:uncharacterized 2Fe-2S/4Fe-4S cluster protein (DUF4445 family)
MCLHSIKIGLLYMKQINLNIVQNGAEQTLSCNEGEVILNALTRNEIIPSGNCSGQGTCGNCRVKVTGKNLPTPTKTEQRHISEADLQSGDHLACQVKAKEEQQIVVKFIVAQTAWHDINDDEYFPTTNTQALPKCLSNASYGIAIDLGTTQIRLTLLELTHKTRIAAKSCLNPQIRFGSDIMTRIATASESQSAAKELLKLTEEIIAKGISSCCDNHGVDSNSIKKLVIVGNTAMLCFLAQKNFDLLLKPEHWMNEIVCSPDSPSLLSDRWNINTDADINLVQPVAGFVGSDLLAAVLYAETTQKDDLTVLIDFGTNSEIALWDGNLLWVTSAAGGPAFDGCGISHGMPAVAGAIYEVMQATGNTGFKCSVLGDNKAKGICGSGLIDAVACLLESGILMSSGRFRKDFANDSVLLYSGDNNIALHKRDIDAFQRAKAAIAAGIITLLHHSKLAINDIKRVIVCGAFGQHLNIGNAQATGLLPELPIERFEIFGNAALAGCEQVLLSNDAEIDFIRKKAKIINLASSTVFESAFPISLYLETIKE